MKVNLKILFSLIFLSFFGLYSGIFGMEDTYKQESILPKSQVHDIRYRIEHTGEYPYCLIGTVSCSIGCGTGTLVSSNVVLTSAHVIYNKRNRQEAPLDDFTFSPGQSGSLLPFGTARVKNFYYPPAYKTDVYPSKNDWALLVLDREIGKEIESRTQKRGWFELKHFSEDDKRRPIETAGYPRERLNEMHGCKGSIVNIEDGLIGHNMDTSKGQSGSCIWREINGDKYILSIHQGGGNSTQNFATLWTESNHLQYMNFLSFATPINLSIPLVDKGHEQIYQMFLNGRLVYKPDSNSDNGKIELRISDLANPLKGTFDLSQCDNAGKYLSISTGYRKVKKAENSNKIEIWFTPRFLVEKEIKTTAKHLSAIFPSKWSDSAPIGIFWMGGWCDNIDWCDYLTTENMENLSKINLFGNWRKATQISHPHSFRSGDGGGLFSFSPQWLETRFTFCL